MIGSDVRPEYVEASIEGTRLFHEYIESLGMPGKKEEVHFHLFHDQDKFIAAYEAATGGKANRNVMESSAVAGKGNINLNALRLEEQNTSLESLQKIIAHEMVHTLQHELAGVRGGSDDYSIPETGPRWLTEGIAEFLAFQAMSASDALGYDTKRIWEFVEQGRRVDKLLSEMETLAGIKTARGSTYDYFLLAAGLLASRTDQSSLIHYYSLLQPGTTWQEAFETAFGLPVEEFYELFEEHRAAGSPKSNVLTPTDTPTPEPTAHPSGILDWFDDPPDDKHSFAANSIERMWDLYPDLAAGVARLIWVGDGITWNEEFVLEELSYVVSEDPELVRAVVNQGHRSYLLEVGSGSAERAADYPWLADGMNARELYAIIEIVRIAKRNPGFAERVLGYTWLSDGINEVEARGLGALSRWTLVAPELVDRVLKYTWLDDGITDAESDTLSVLYSFAEHGGVYAAKQVMDYQWLADGVTWEEYDLIAELARLVEDDPEAARQISLGTLVPYLLGLGSDSAKQAAGYLWLADGVNALELRTIIGIARVAERNPGFAERLLSYSWLADGITGAEARGLDVLSRWALQVPELAERLLGYSWLADGISQRELNGISELADIARADLVLARQVVGMGILDDPLRDRDLHAITSLRRLIETDDLALLTSQPWFADDLNDEETAFLAVANRDQHSDTMYRDFLRTHFTRSTTISLPLAGDVDVWVFWHLPFPDSDDTVELIEDAARALEALMGVPFPTTDIILLLGDPDSISFSGYNAGNYVAMDRIVGEGIHRGVVYHETAHYYYMGIHSWFNEGFADLVVTYTMTRVGLRNFAEREKYLEEYDLPECVELGFRNIQELLDKGGHACLGEFILVSLFNLLGEEATSATLRELYLMSGEQSEEDFYRVFLKHTPPELKDEFRDLYRRLHGGPAADAEK